MMMRTTYDHRPTIRRAAFTLVEVMVAAALSVVIMTIIATAFQVGLDTTSQLKSIGGLADQLRTAHGIIRSDLRAPHLFDDNTDADLPISDPTVTTWVRVLGVSPAPDSDTHKWGYFRIDGTSTAQPLQSEAIRNGLDPGSARSAGQWMAFTVKLGAGTPEDAFAAAAPDDALADASLSFPGLASQSGQFVSPWAEVCYFLVGQGTKTTPDTGTGEDLFTLRRRQRLLANTEMAGPITQANAFDNFPEMSIVNPANLTLNTPSTVTISTNRIGNGARPTGLSSTNLTPDGRDYRGSDIVLGNVISMRIQALVNDEIEFKDLGESPVPTAWDSATNTGTRLRAVRIQLRVYDSKNRLTRQITIDQAL